MKESREFVVSIGELVDRIAILNVKIWHAEEALSVAKEKNDMKKVAEIAILTRELNRERADLREGINYYFENQRRGSTKLNYLELGRGK